MNAALVESLVFYVHFMGILVLASTLVAENLLIKPQQSVTDIRLLAAIDAVYGLSAIIAVAAGLMLWLGVGKPAAFYSANPVFHLKLALVVLIALLSIIPTLYFLKNRNQPVDVVKVPKSIIVIKRLELIVLAIVPLLAALMARGIGISN